MDADELQSAIEKSMEGQQKPVLIISDPHKLRIMSITSKDNTAMDKILEDRQDH